MSVVVTDDANVSSSSGQWQQCEEEWLVDSRVERLSPFESISFTLALEREWRMALTNGGLDRG